MILTLNLSDEQARVLRAKAAAEGAVESREGRRRRHISEIISENMSRVPAEIMATLPTDGASEHDHYIYGLPKRNS